MASQKTRTNHAYVVWGTTEASDELIDFIEQHDDLDLTYQRHSPKKLLVEEEAD